MTDRQLLAALDACRPGTSDWDDPALGNVARLLADDEPARELRGRIERMDVRIEAALHAAEVPKGLAERVLAHVSAEPRDDERVATTDAPLASPVSPADVKPASIAALDAPAPATTPYSGRRLFLLGGVCAAAAAVMLAIGLPPVTAQPWTADQVLDAAIGFYARDAHRGEGRSLADRPADFPYSPDLIEPGKLSQVRWRRLAAGFAGADVVAYDLAVREGGPRATLYVLAEQEPIAALPEEAPPSPSTPSTQGVCAAAWRHRGMVYVLVVEGGPREYRQFLGQANRDWV